MNPIEQVERMILLVRGHKVILDTALAELYGVSTRKLKQAVRRNRDRFPEDFVFELSLCETSILTAGTQIIGTQGDRSRSQIVTLKELSGNQEDRLRSQIVTSKTKKPRGGARYGSFAFTEQGVAMLSSVLRSPRAILVNIEIMRTFVRLRQLFTSHAGLARKLEELENKYDAQFKVVFDAIRALMEPASEDPEKGRIGFHRE